MHSSESAWNVSCYAINAKVATGMQQQSFLRAHHHSDGSFNGSIDNPKSGDGSR